MPETAKILRFPVREAEPLNAADAMVEARNYFEALSGAPSAVRSRLVQRPDVLMALCVVLRENLERNAGAAGTEAEALYRCILASERPGTFDEADYFAGETALIAAIAHRVLGNRSDCEAWLDRAEAGFRQTINPTPLFAGVTYQRLALRCESGRYEEVAELAPMLAMTFARLNMAVDEAKCVFLEGLALKQSGRHEASIQRFQSVQHDFMSEREPGLVGLAFVNIADVHAASGNDEQASEAYSRALPLLARAKKPIALAHLKGVIGETLQRQGRLGASIQAYRAAAEDYAQLGMTTWVVYLRLSIAGALLQMGKHREAEWEVLAALPTIDEQRMVPEGFAALSLLQESVRQRKTDPNALLEVREYIRASS